MTFRDQVRSSVEIDGGVLVGDDGSRAAAKAVRFAVDEARRRGTALHVLRAWTIMSGVRPDDLPAGVAPSMPELEAATLAAEQRRVAELVGDAGVEVEVHTCHGPAAQALIRASKSADVVVVGSRGLGGFASLVLGSVADQVVRYADNAVIVVPA